MDTRLTGPGDDTASWDFVLSTDGGETFTAPRRIRVDRTGNLAALPPRARRQQLPQFGIDSDGGVPRDRIYMAFPRIVDDIARVYFQFSDTVARPGARRSRSMRRRRRMRNSSIRW